MPLQTNQKRQAFSTKQLQFSKIFAQQNYYCCQQGSFTLFYLYAEQHFSLLAELEHLGTEGRNLEHAGVQSSSYSEFIFSHPKERGTSITMTSGGHAPMGFPKSKRPQTQIIGSVQPKGSLHLFAALHQLWRSTRLLAWPSPPFPNPILWADATKYKIRDPKQF